MRRSGSGHPLLLLGTLLLLAVACGEGAGRPVPHGAHGGPVYGGPSFPGLKADWVDATLAEHAAHGHGAAGAEAEDEHAGEEGHHHGNPNGPFSAEQLKRVVSLHVARIARRDGGVFVVRDEAAGEDLELVLREVLDPVLRHDHLGYFLLAEFERAGDPDSRYLVEFWLTYPNFKLEVTGVAIQADERRVGDRWEVVPRYVRATEKTKILDDAAS